MRPRVVRPCSEVQVHFLNLSAQAKTITKVMLSTDHQPSQPSCGDIWILSCAPHLTYHTSHHGKHSCPLVFVQYLHITYAHPPICFFFFKNFTYLFICLFIYFWLCWVFVSVRGLSLVAASGGHSSSRCAGLSLSRPLLLQSTGSRRTGSAVVAHGLSCSVACGIFPDQGSNPCPLHWQADS